MAPTRTHDASEYSIAGVSKLTGVSCHALRVWERRYAFPVPNRSESGHRRYSLGQVLTLCKIVELAHQGRLISDVIADLKAGKIVVEPEPTTTTGDPASENGEFFEFLGQILSGDMRAADKSFDRLRDQLGTENLLDRVIAPALTETGERWFRRDCSIYQERFVTVFIRRKLDAMIEAARGSHLQTGRTILIGTVQGERHDGGALIVNVLLELAGWHVINLGADVPVSEYAKAVERIRPDALALSFVLSRNVNKRFEELAAIKQVPVFVGGRSILNYQGLAKRYGLIPIAGPIQSAVEQLNREMTLRGLRKENGSQAQNA